MLQNRRASLQFVITVLFVAIFCTANLSIAAALEDVKILKVYPNEGKLSLTLQLKNGSKDSFFYVDIVKTDPEAFEKTLQVIQKLNQGEKFILNLNIPSFSASPSGSYYRSDGISFYSSSSREPNEAKSIKKKK